MNKKAQHFQAQMEKKHFFFTNQNNDEKDIFKQFVMSSDLSVRASNVLLTNVNSFEEFGQLTEEVLSEFRNCGKKTVREILSFLDTAKLEREIIPPSSTEKLLLKPPISTEELLSKPPIDSTIELLPVFSNNPLPNVSLKDLHSKFQAEVKIEDVQLSERTFNDLKQNRLI